MGLGTFSPRLVRACLVAAAAAALFHFAGNATRGYLDTPSLFVWLGAQWFSPLDDMAHGPLVVVAAAWLIVRAFRQARPAPANAKEPGRAWLWLLGGLALHAFGYAIQMPRVSWFAFLLVVLAVVEWAGGAEVRRRAFAGVALLLLAMSWAFVDTWGVALQLRLSVTAAVHAVLETFGAGTIRQGTLLIPAGGGQPLEVAAACAGMRSTAALLTLAVVLGEWFRLTLLRRLLVLGTALAAVWVGNTIRVLGLVGLALAGGSAAEGWLHSGWGVVVFLGEVVAVYAVGRKEVEEAEEVEEREEREEREEGRAWGGCALAVLCVAGVALWTMRSAGVATAPVATLALPTALGDGWVGVEAPMSELERSVMPAGTEWERRVFVDRWDRRRQALATVVWAGGDRTGIHRPELCLRGMGWAVVGRRVEAVGGQGELATVLELRREDGRRGAMVYWFAEGGRAEATYAGMLGAWVGDRLWRRGGRWGYFAVQALGSGGDDGGVGVARAVAGQLRGAGAGGAGP
ncbi:exosortase/archaeosortase family protein [Nibricoccus sp. IMCC34717]|uniref:exosortase/archaeosortase family protein n=1 Tax=Nibricoccus sp. IMCC34717 TaxID=3034021 RepID=UPI00384D188E